MIPAVSQTTTMPAPLEDELEALGELGLEIWLTKIEAFLQAASFEALASQLDRHPVSLVAASLQGGLWQPDPAARAEAWQLFEKRLDLCRRLEIPVLVVAADRQEPVAPEKIDELIGLWRRAGDRAAEHGVRLALESRHDAAVANNLLSLGALIQQAGHPHVGWCLDVFHWFVGPSQTEDFQVVPTDRLFHVQVCDLEAVPREWAQDRHRILPGDGSIPLAPVFDWLERIGYTGAVSVELFHPLFWELPAVQVIEAVRGSLARFLPETPSQDDRSLA